jgi:DNA-binding CsgD family transcriptional regulator
LSSARSVWKGQPASIVIFRDISGRKQAEEVLRKRETDLELRTNELEEVNSALRVLLKRREDDKSDLEEKVLSNVKELVVPYVERLKKSGLDAKQGTYVNILESNLEDIVSPFVRKLSSTYLGLTPTEIHVANLVKEARDSKTIAQLLNMSPRTVESHRQNIRKKLGLKNKKANLRSHLMSIQ